MDVSLARAIVKAVIDDDATDAVAPALQTLLDELDRRQGQVEREQAVRIALIRLVDDVVSDDSPDLRDSVMIQAGTSGLLQVPA